MKTLRTILATVIFTVMFVSISNSAETKTGKEVFQDSKCMTCHCISAQGLLGKACDKYPDLSKFGEQGKTEEWVKKYLTKEEKLNSKTHPIKFKGSDEDFSTLAKWLISLK